MYELHITIKKEEGKKERKKNLIKESKKNTTVNSKEKCKSIR